MSAGWITAALLSPLVYKRGTPGPQITIVILYLCAVAGLQLLPPWDGFLCGELPPPAKLGLIAFPSWGLPMIALISVQEYGFRASIVFYSAAAALYLTEFPSRLVGAVVATTAPFILSTRVDAGLVSLVTIAAVDLVNNSCGYSSRTAVLLISVCIYLAGSALHRVCSRLEFLAEQAQGPQNTFEE